MKTDETKQSYEIEESLENALEMMGKGYEPAAIIEQPRQRLILREGLGEEWTVAWVKLSTAFKPHIKELKGSPLAVWLFISLSINKHGVAFPSIQKIADETGYSRQGVMDAVAVLEEKGYLKVRRGERRFNLYEPEFAAIGKTNEPSETVNLVDSSENGQVYSPNESTFSPNESTPLDSNKSNKIEQDSSEKPISKPTSRIDRTEAEQAELDEKKNAWLFPTSQAEIDENIFSKEAVDNFESCLHFNPLPWSQNRDWEKFEKFVIAEYRKDKTVWQRYDEWRKDKGKFVGAMSNKAIKYRPADFIACFPDFLAHTAMYGEGKKRDVSVGDGEIYV